MAAYAYTRPFCTAPVGGPTVFATIGTSILRGALPSAGSFLYRGGWRPYAWTAMTNSGQNPDFIGDTANSAESPAVTNCGTGHGGHNGSTSAQWVSSIYTTWKAALSSTPHIIGIELGANDGDTAQIAGNIATLVDTVATDFPRAAILVATRLKAASSTANFGATHRAQVMADIAARKANGMHVTLVDQWLAVEIQDLWDGLHPGTRGYQLLGDLWSRYLVALANGLAAA